MIKTKKMQQERRREQAELIEVPQQPSSVMDLRLRKMAVGTAVGKVTKELMERHEPAEARRRMELI
jgi:hypothetical protein